MPLVYPFRRRYQLIIILVICLTGIFYFNVTPYFSVPCKEFSSCDDTQTLSSEPLIFIGGYPRSGTTLMRVLLDVHPDVRCGPETHILPLILYLYSFKIKTMYNRLRMANITDELVDSIFIKAISTLIHEAGPPAGRLCAKDPFIDICLKQLLHLYPNAKFILMVRDGRAVTQSVLSRNIRISKLDVSSPEKVLETWDKHYKHVLPNCLASPRCRVVRYEDLVLRPKENLQSILHWLQIPWDDVVLEHDQNMESVNLPQIERSTSQVVFPIYTEALTRWSQPDSKIPESLINKSQSFEMMRHFGYANLSIPPVYGIPEPEVEERARLLAKNAEFKKLFTLMIEKS